MATFGQTVAGGSSDTWGNTSNVYVKAVSVPATNGALTSISLYCSISSGTPALQVALYSHEVSGDIPEFLLASTEVGTLVGAGAAFVQTNLAYPSIIAGTQYWLGFKIDTGVINAFYNNTNLTKYRGDGPRVWDDPAGPTAGIAEGVSIFATYTEVGTNNIVSVSLWG